MNNTVHHWKDGPVDFDGRVSISEWVESLPTFEGRRPMMTCNGYLNLLRHMLAGGEVPYYNSPVKLLSDVILAHQNETGQMRRALEITHHEAERGAPALRALWALVYATGKRKTMRTEDVRAALEAGRG